MADSGGSATVYGVLYQILGSLKWIKELRLRGSKEAGELVSAQLVLEPLDGGDLQVSAPTTRIVEQCKARRSTRPWSLREIVREVFPDLLRAVDLSRPNVRCDYRFVTEGKCSDWPGARKLFTSMKELGLPENPLSALPDNDSSKQKFFSAKSPAVTPRQFFKDLLTEVAQASGTPELAEDVGFARQTWHLVANLEIVPDVQADELLARLDDLVAKLVDNPDDRLKARNDLIARLLQLATVAGTTLSPTEFLRQAKLDTVSLDDWKSVFQRINAVAADEWHELFRYDAKLDVRSSDLPDSSTSVLLVTGDSERSGPGGSGCGKSFYLGAMAHRASALSELVVASRALGSDEKTLGRVASIIWNRGFGRSSSLSLESIATALKRECIGLPTIWLTVLVDDLRSADETRELLEFPWQSCGIRLIAAAPLSLAMSLQQSQSGSLQVRNLYDFSAAEVREYLRRRQISWGSLPSDMRSLLRWPLLAQLYCDLSSDGHWRPENEYALFKRTWNRLVEDLRQLSHEDDQAKLRELIASTVKGEASYPWDMKSCTALGLDSDAINRLANAGWASREDGRVRIRHHRLLCWAIAEALADQFRCNGTAAIGLISDIVKEAPEQSNRFENAELGYVAMDLLWLSTDSSSGRPTDAHQLIELMADEGEWSRRDNLFEHLIPTLGARAAPVLAHYLRSKKPTQFAQYINWVTTALKRIGNGAPLEVARVAADMLADPYLGTAYSAVQVLEDYPCPEALDGLWSWLDGLCRWKAQASEGDRGIPSFRESDILDALVSCAALDPQWLSRRSSASGSDITALNNVAHILARLDGDEPTRIWAEIGGHLRGVLGGGSVGLTECVARFRDNAFLPLIEEWLGAAEFSVQSAARDALAVLAPLKLVEHLRRGVAAEHLFFNGGWLPLLLVDCRKQTVEVFEALITSSPAKAPSYGRCIEAWIDVFPPSTVKALIAVADSLAVECENGPGGELDLPLLTGLRLLAKIAEPPLIDVLRSCRGSSFEQRLVRLGMRWVEERIFPHLGLESLLEVLRHIASDGLTEVVNAMLRSDLRERRLDGIEWAAYAPNSETRSLLRKVALTHDDGLALESRPHIRLLQDHATKRLAELCEDVALIESLLQQEQDILTLSDLRRDQPAMEDTAIDAALRAIKSDDSHAINLALKALGVTGRRDLIPLLLTHERADSIESERSFAAICGLVGLHADDDDSIAAFGRHLDVDKHRHKAINGLLLSGRPSARIALLEQLESSFQVEPMSADEQAALILTRDPELRDRAMRLLETYAKPREKFRDLFRSTEHLEVLGEVADAQVRDALFDEADPLETNFHIEGRRASAIRGLAKQAPADAAEAAQRALQTGKYGRADFPDVVVELKGADAVPLLLNQMKVERNQLVRRAIGLALRKCKARQMVLHSVAELLRSTAAAERKAAAEVIGWLGPDTFRAELQSALRSETLASVRWSIARALYRHQQQATMASLLEAVKTSSGVALWDYVDTLLELDDAKLVGLEEDPLWVWPRIEQSSSTLQRHVDKRYSERIKEIKRKLKHAED